MALTLRIRHNSRLTNQLSASDHAGWLLTGRSAAEWLHEMLRWQCDLSSARLRYLPATNSTENCGGLFVTLDQTPSVRVHGIPYILRARCSTAQQLFVPGSAEIFPPVENAELEKLLEHDSIVDYIWTPATGLIGFEADHIFGIDQLLSAPDESPTDWSTAQPGVRLNQSIVSIEPLHPPTIEQVLQQARDDIGSSPALDELPRSDNEQTLPTKDQALGWVLKPIAKSIRWLTSRKPKTSKRPQKPKPESAQNRGSQSRSTSGPSWAQQLNNWANGILSGSSALFQKKRERELQRLMDMLKSDPDKGLRYAIPFNTEGTPQQGRAGSNLVENNVDFSSPGGGGSTVGDYWDMSWQMRAELQQRYRDLAQREQSLGRYRRAAYIYAHLLGDNNMAAQVLAAGGHYHEAAALYRDKLNRPRDAAKCLKNGGLWLEAAEAYLELNAWEDAAELFDQLEDFERARETWKAAADNAERAESYLKAAKIHEEKLHDFDTAYAILNRAWQHGRSGRSCLRESFALLGRHNQHELAQAQLAQLRDEAASARRDEIVIEILQEQSHNYPDASLKLNAADATRRIASRNLSRAERLSSPQLFLKALRNLTPDDKLLERDCHRFTTSVKSRTGPPARHKDTVKFVEVSFLSPTFTWQAAIFSQGAIFAVGQTDTKHGSEFTIARTKLQTAQLAFDRSASRTFRIRQGVTFLVAANQQGLWPVLLYSPDTALNSVGKSAHVAFPHLRDKPIVAMDVSPTGTQWVLCYDPNEDSLLLRSSQGGRQPIPGVSKQLGLNFQHSTALACAGTEVFLSIDHYLFSHDSYLLKPHQAVSEFGAPITEIVAQNAAGASRLALLHPEGGTLYWPSTEQTAKFGSGLFHPVAAFSNRGRLIVGDEKGTVEIYRSNTSGDLDLITTIKPYDAKIVSIACLQHAEDAFVLIYENGRMALYTI